MGVVVPKIEASSVHKKLNEHGYGIIGTSSRIDEAVDSMRYLSKKYPAAEIETTMKKLLEDIEKTKRRVNALSSRLYPSYRCEELYNARLEEMEERIRSG